MVGRAAPGCRAAPTRPRLTAPNVSTFSGIHNMLSVRRKADRAIMAERVRALAVECGAKAEIKSTHDPREIRVTIEAARGLLLSVDLDGASPIGESHVLSWHTNLETDARLSDRFGDVNPCHYRKSTDIADDFESMLSILKRRLEQCADGSAFDADREARMIAKNGETAAERNARFARYRAEAGVHA